MLSAAVCAVVVVVVVHDFPYHIMMGLVVVLLCALCDFHCFLVE